MQNLQTPSEPRRVSVGSWYPRNPMSSRVKMCQVCQVTGTLQLIVFLLEVGHRGAHRLVGIRQCLLCSPDLNRNPTGIAM